MVLAREQIGLLVKGQATMILIARGDEPPDSATSSYRPGRVIALQPAVTKPATCKVRVVSCSDVALQELDDDTARELGYRAIAGDSALDQLRDAWVKRGRVWDQGNALLLVVEVDRSEKPRLLASQSGRHGRRALAGHGYTTDPAIAMRGAGEAVDPDAVAGFTRAALRTEQRLLEELLAERAKLPAPLRLARLLADAERRRVDVSSELRLICRKLSDAEKRVYRSRTATRD